MAGNDFSRKELSIQPTVTPGGSYAEKKVMKIFGESPLSGIAKNLEYYNPKLKELREIREQKILEKGYAELNKILEDTGGDIELLKEYNKAGQERKEMIALNPYLPRLLDREILQRLAIQKDKDAVIEYNEKMKGRNLDPDNLQAAMAEFDRTWNSNHNLSRYDQREVAEIMGKSRIGIEARIQGLHMEDRANFLIARRKELYQAALNEVFEDKNNNGLSGLLAQYRDTILPEWTPDVEENGKVYSVKDQNADIEKGLSKSLDDTDFWAKLNAREKDFMEIKGMTPAEAHEATLEYIESKIIAEPGEAEIYLFVAKNYRKKEK